MRTRISAIKFRIYPDEEQRTLLAKHFGCTRFIYNHFLAKSKEDYERDGIKFDRMELQRQMVAMKKEEETKWLKEVYSQSLQESLKNLSSAFSRFFKKKSKFPRFKSRKSRQRYCTTQNGRIENDKEIYVPKVGKIKAKITQEFTGKTKSFTLEKTPSGKYFCSVVLEIEEEEPEKRLVLEETTVGIDLGLTNYAVLSTGEKIKNPRHLKGKIKKLRRAHRRLSRAQKGSKRRDKRKVQLAREYEKVTNSRNDFLHKTTTALVRDNQTDTFAIENLAVDNMMKNHRLARSIADAAWGTFRQFLTYKAERDGKNVLVIGRFEPSSKMCTCGTKNDDLKLSDRSWTCQSCGETHDRDLLAARNIKRFALENYATDPAQPVPVAFAEDPEHPVPATLGRGTPEFTLVESRVSDSLKRECSN